MLRRDEGVSTMEETCFIYKLRSRAMALNSELTYPGRVFHMGFRKKEKKVIFHQKRNENEQSNSEKTCFIVSII